MNIADMIAQSGALGSIAKELGVPESVAKVGAEALLPAVLGGFKKQAQAQPSGLEGLGGLLGQLGGGGLLDAVLAPEPTPVAQGNDVLGQIFGSKDVSRSVAGHAAESTGIDSSLLKKMLPMLAMLVAGYLAKQGGASQGGASQGNSASGGGLGDLIGSVLGGSAGGSSGGGMGGMIGNVLGGMLGGGGQAAPASASGALGNLGSLIDMNGDGNPLDDILGMAAKLGR
ncbi:MAG: hypothetical protein RLZZ58_964 [Pseudomonadota bacterium]